MLFNPDKSMTHTLHERVLTLAGLFQCAALVRRTATGGVRLDPPVETCINSLFITDPQTVEAIYTSEAHLRLGLNSLIQQMGNDARLRDVELTRYVVTLLYLEKKLSKNSAMQTKLQEGIELARSQVSYFSPTHENVIASLAGLYQETISQLNPTIMVSGEQHLLANPETASLIRTLLLAGIRSAVAWRQCGGTRLQLIFKRRALLQEAQDILDKLPAIDTMV